MSNEKSDSATWDLLFEPKMSEVAGMVSHLSDRFTPEQFRLLTGTTMSTWPLIASGKRDCDKLVKRVIWFLYMLDTAPDKILRDPESIFMWGKNIQEIPKLSDLTVKEKEAVMVEYIKMIRRKRRDYSVDEIAYACKVTPGLAKKVCDRLKYKTFDHNLSDVYTPGSRWYRMDWRKTAVQLSGITGIKLTTIRAARTRLAKMPAPIAARNIFRSKDAKFDWFWHLWDELKQKEVHHEAELLRQAAIKALDKTTDPVVSVIRNDEKQFENARSRAEKARHHQLCPDASKPDVPSTHEGAGPQHLMDDQPSPRPPGIVQVQIPPPQPPLIKNPPASGVADAPTAAPDTGLLT